MWRQPEMPRRCARQAGAVAPSHKAACAKARSDFRDFLPEPDRLRQSS